MVDLLFNLRQKNPDLKVFTGDRCNNQNAEGHCLGHKEAQQP
ncbi:hypothetical protein nrt1_33860 [Pseudomonas aeruginosa]|nr:hypothetical protein T266_12800 [Pseudomonas aeruginosa VRFPA05]